MNMTFPFTIASALYFALHTVALILAVAYWRRCPNVSLLVLIGSLLNLMASTVRMVLPMIFPEFSAGIGHLVLSIVSLTGTGLYLAAIFTDRRPIDERLRRPRLHVEDEWDRPVPPPTEPGNTGIKKPQP